MKPNHNAERSMRARSWFCIAVVVGVALAGCRSCHHDDSAQSNRPTHNANDAASSTNAANAGPLQTVRHDCSGLAALTPCPASSATDGDALMLLSEKLSELAALHKPPPSSWWDSARSALATAARVDHERLRFEERVAMQNAALFLALATNSAKGANDAAFVRGAVDLARRLAFSSKDPRPPTNPPASALDGWIGPSSSWTERSKDGVMFHEIVHHHTRVFRLVRAPQGVHANFSQLIAVDDQGRPFLTPVVGSIEIRRGEADDSPACLGMLSPERLRCASSSSLVPVVDLDALPNNHFVRREGGRLKCNECHSAKTEDRGMVLGTHDIDAGFSHASPAIEAELARRRAMVLDELAKALAPLWH